MHWLSFDLRCQSGTFYSYNTLTRDMTKIYARFTRARSVRVRVRIFIHIPSDRVITVIFYIPVDENDYR